MGRFEKALTLIVGIGQQSHISGVTLRSEVNDLDNTGKHAPFVISIEVLHNVIVFWNNYVP